MNSTRILLVDDHEVVRLGLRALLEGQPNLKVVGEADTSATAVQQAEQLHPNIVLMDIRIPGEGGVEATRQIMMRLPETRVIILTSYADDELIWRAVNAGAVGYVLKQVGNVELVRAIEAVRRGEAFLDPEATRRMLTRVRSAGRSADEDAFRGLSDRELAILSALTRGETNIEIARVLQLSEKSVSNSVSKLLDKLHLAGRVELATYAIEHNIAGRLKNRDRG